LPPKRCHFGGFTLEKKKKKKKKRLLHSFTFFVKLLSSSLENKKLFWCVWMRYLEAGFEEKPEIDEGIYQFHRLVAIREGIANFCMDF
jgi:hypothetical protein